MDTHWKMYLVFYLLLSRKICRDALLGQTKKILTYYDTETSLILMRTLKNKIIGTRLTQTAQWLCGLDGEGEGKK